jgi:hypothetical protein
MEEALVDVRIFQPRGCSGVVDMRSLRFVTLFWPKKVKASKLEEIHGKMVMKESSGAKQDPLSYQRNPVVVR